MRRRERILFLQLPHLENDVSGEAENLPLASVYLRCALERSAEARHYDAMPPDPSLDPLDDAHLVARCVARKPAVIAVTLYLWNVERSLRVLGLIRDRLPAVRIVVGGPEVARRHPFLFRCRALNAAVTGEGELAFPAVLRAFRRRASPDLDVVAWRAGGRLAWGRRLLPNAPLTDLIPPAAHALNRPDAKGVAYLETTRGCPLRCTFCCYNQRRHGISHLPANEVVRRVRVLARRGAREIRLVDPTFNAHPEFTELLRRMSCLPEIRHLRFFAELRADTITAEQAELLAAANFHEVEIGVQSRDPAVLRRIRRPADQGNLLRGLRRVTRRGVKATVDIMCGLPGQTPADLRNSLRWAAGLRRARVQFLHTLAIPGTELRDTAAAWGLQVQARPPYRVVRTPQLSEEAIGMADQLAARLTGQRLDTPTRQFVGRALPDLFPEQVRVDVVDLGPGFALPGRENRRAVVFQGPDLFAARDRLGTVLRKALRSEPCMLWQFVLAPAREEPLDLVEHLAAVLDAPPRHLLDRMSVRPGTRARAARRLFILLAQGRRYDPAWVAQADDLLRHLFV